MSKLQPASVERADMPGERTAEIILFPGVRYDRAPLAEQPRVSRRSEQHRDWLELSRPD